MNQTDKFMVILLIVVSSFTSIGISRSYTNKKIKSNIPTSSNYYDSEGNALPNSVVTLLVKSQYIKITNKQQDTLNYYFPINK